MIVYSLLLTVALAVSAPWWIWRMATSGRYRAGLRQRLGFVPDALRRMVAGKRVVWVHAVSVGEVLACARLVGELREALPGWAVVVSTTTATGQKVARERFGDDAVFYYPLDFAYAVRAYLRVLKPELLVLVESEFWPRMLVECERAGVPVAVVNARISDRSFPRYMRLRRLWRPLLEKVRLFLSQGEESADRLLALGVAAGRIATPGNMKYDMTEPRANSVAEKIREIANGRKILVAGSTVDRSDKSLLSEDEILIQAWERGLRQAGVLLVLAPRQPDRFPVVWGQACEFRATRASSFGSEDQGEPEIIVLDTLGDLASVYGIADVAFVGGSLVAQGGHNPLEAARFGVPVVMGSSYENFREIVEGMRAAEAICVLDAGAGAEELEEVVTNLIDHGQAMGERGRTFYESRQGATGRTLRALLELVGERAD